MPVHSMRRCRVSWRICSARRPSTYQCSASGASCAAQRAACLAYAGQLDEARAILARFINDRTIRQVVHGDETPTPIVVALLEAAVLTGETSAAERRRAPESGCESGCWRQHADGHC